MPPTAKKRVLPFVAPVALISLVGLILARGEVLKLWMRLATVSDSSFDSNAIRQSLWAGVLLAIRGQPMIGFGSASFADTLYPIIGPDALYGHAHNNYLEQLFLYGFVGAGLFVLLLLAMALHVWRNGDGTLRMAGLAAMIVFGIDSLFEATWQSFNVAETLFLIVGLTSSVSYLTGGESRISSLRTNSVATVEAPR
ncbi:MAG: O-antigen ligase family protein [Microbacteriaceae bacterium]|nr:O-antigen ligase family protein [Microbacteriaceae bacterium]